MGSEAKTGGATTTNKSATAAAAAAAGGGGGGGGGGGFRAKLEYYLYSGEKKHVIAGIAIIGALFGVPWYLMNRGSKHRSHQDYMEKADRARRERLSGGPSSAKYPTGG